MLHRMSAAYVIHDCTDSLLHYSVQQSQRCVANVPDSPQKLSHWGCYHAQKAKAPVLTLVDEVCSMRAKVACSQIF